MQRWMKELRQQKGYTQEQVAQLANISRCYYVQLESGKYQRTPSPKAAKRIAQVLEFDWTRFFQDEG